MKLKRIISTTLACVVALSALTACNNNDTDTSDTSVWERDASQHWIESKNGKKKEAGKHDLIDNVCVICDSEVWTYEDGTADVYNYNEYGDFSRLTSYDADGNIVFDTKYEYEYDPDGNMFKHKQYDSDVLVEECDYYVDFDGNSILSLQTFYHEDGTKDIYECDGNGNIVKEIFCDTEGIEWIKLEYAYTYLSEDDFFMSTKIEYFDDVIDSIEY